MSMELRHKKLDAWKVLLLFVLLSSLSPSTLAVDTATGTVRNGSTGRAAVSEDVILLRLDQGMEEEGRTKTDSQGAFKLNVLYPDKLHLVRVVHQAVTYDRQISAGDAVSMDVFDAAHKVSGVTGGAEIMRVGTKGNLLHVSDMYDIKNGSSPRMTQAGQRTFDFYLPANAKVDSVLAAGPGGIGVLISAAPVKGEPGHYAVNFPLRPGDTKFAVNYDLPYDGRAAFHPRIAYPVQQLAIMVPPTMKFTSRSSDFHPLATGNTDFQVRVANQVKAGDVPGFEISGTGVLPPLRERVKSQVQSPPPSISSPPATASRNPHLPDLSKRNPGSERLQSSTQRLILGVVSIFILVACGFLIWRVRIRWNVTSARTSGLQISSARPSTTLLEALKEELFQLETDRLRGSISAKDYASTKQTLEETIRRAVTKTG